MTGHTPTGGCSRESSAMGESLTERRYVNEEALRGVKFFYVGGTPPLAGRQYHMNKGMLILCQQQR